MLPKGISLVRPVVNPKPNFFLQDFFNNLYDELGIALENIVYYKDETHYFVMTTKKHSLLDRKVLKKASQL